MFHIILYKPEIPQNTGNIMRLCANTGSKLHIIRPMGFIMDDKKLRRAGMDYAERSTYKIYDNFESCFEHFNQNNTIYLCTTRAEQFHTKVNYKAGDILMFGSESKGVPQEIHNLFEKKHKVKIPMTKDGRSLNLATAAAIITYEAWRQTEFVNLHCPVYD